MRVAVSRVLAPGRLTLTPLKPAFSVDGTLQSPLWQYAYDEHRAQASGISYANGTASPAHHGYLWPCESCHMGIRTV